MTSTGYSVFGVSMERQSTRRKLVVLVYAALAVLCAGSIVFARTEPLVYSWTLYATMGVSIFIFGGQGRYGLIKPFPNKPPRPEPVMVDVVRLQLAPMTAGTPDDASWKNDERELSRRDRAHYQAYSTVGFCLLAILLLAALGLQTALGSSHLQWLSVTVVLQLIFGSALAGSVLMVTLPSAIILWTEPNIDVG
jgi:hypothetical protein